MEVATKIVRAPWEFYCWLESMSDSKTKGWPLCGSPLPMLSIIFAYVYFCKVIGPRWMEKREPFRLEPLMVVYNAFMVVITTYFFIRGGSYTYFGNYNWICQPLDQSDSPVAAKLRNLSWWYMILRTFEMADTVFFVLRKKFRQISNLHVVHHSLTSINIWVGIKLGLASGNHLFFALINGFVHIIMYLYYFLASLGPGMQKYLWWKKYLTLLQMVQFAVVFVHGLLPFFYDCGFPIICSYLILAEAVLFLAMFANFYYVTYKRGKSAVSSKRVQLNGISPELTQAVEPNSHYIRKGGTKEH